MSSQSRFRITKRQITHRWEGRNALSHSCTGIYEYSFLIYFRGFRRNFMHRVSKITLQKCSVESRAMLGVIPLMLLYVLHFTRGNSHATVAKSPGFESFYDYSNKFIVLMGVYRFAFKISLLAFTFLFVALAFLPKSTRKRSTSYGSFRLDHSGLHLPTRTAVVIG